MKTFNIFVRKNRKSDRKVFAKTVQAQSRKEACNEYARLFNGIWVSAQLVKLNPLG